MEDQNLNEIEITPLEPSDLEEVAGGAKPKICSIHHCSYPQM